MGKIKLKDFRFTLDGLKLYHPGDCVIGNLEIALDGELHLSDLSVSMLGVVKTHWTETTGSGFITKGIHPFSFAFQLPKENLYSPFVSHYGSIEYTLEAETLKQSLFKHNYRDIVKLLVEVEFERIKDENMLEPLFVSGQENINGILTAPGSVSFNASIEKQIFSPDDSIQLICSVNNKT